MVFDLVGSIWIGLNQICINMTKVESILTDLTKNWVVLLQAGR